MIVTVPPTTYAYPKFNLGDATTAPASNDPLFATPGVSAAPDGTVTVETSPGIRIWSWLSVASMAASTYHGWRRNKSIGWAVVWGLMGAAFPVVTPVIAVAQGFGKEKK